jgi:hypothetical protein
MMEISHAIDVISLDIEHRRAFEDVIGTPLQGNQRLLISVTEVGITTDTNNQRPVQSLSDWTNIYSGLTDEQIESIDRNLKTRSDLTRHLP